MREILACFVALGLALPAGVMGEPRYAEISATATVASTSIARSQVRFVTLHNAGSKDVWFRLFTDADTAVEATAAAPSSRLPAGGTLEYRLTDNDSETFVNGVKAKYYKSISTICGGSDTTTVYVWFK